MKNNKENFLSKFFKKKLNIDEKNKNGFILELKNVEKTYKNNSQKILKNINLEIRKNDFVVIVGKSGSGKTTLINILSGLTKASKGDVIVNDKNLSKMSNSQLTNFRRKNISYIFQEFGLLPTLNIYDNVLLGFNLNKKNKDKKEIDQVLKSLSLFEHKKKFPNELSGGQQQRTSIARAIVKNSSILFADEPTSALDLKMSQTVLEIFKKINNEKNTTIIMITHDEKIKKLANLVITINKGTIVNISRNNN